MSIKERREFEQKLGIKGRFKNWLEDENRYAFSLTHKQWQAWQAAKAPANIQPDELPTNEDDILYAIKDAIEALGEGEPGHAGRSGYCFSANESAAAAMQVIRPILRSMKRESGDEPYLVWSNEHNAWWGENHCGYVNRVENAGRYSKEEALTICQGANYGWNIDMERPNELPIAESAAMRMGVQKEYRAKSNSIEEGKP